MFVVSEAEAAAIRTAFEQQGELSAGRLYHTVLALSEPSCAAAK
jgi:hypothetical protein